MQVTPLEIGRLKGRYAVVWYELQPDGKPKRRRFRLKAKNKTDAWAEGQRRYETELALIGMKLTLEDVWKIYTAHLSGRKTARDLEFVWQYIGPELGSYHPLQINDDVVKRYLEIRTEDFQRRNGRPPSKSTLRADINLLQCTLNHAYKKRIIDKPIQLKLPPQGSPRDRWLEVDEIDKLLEACKQTPHIYVAVVLMLSTAGRVGAVLELTWDPVDFDRRTIDLRVREHEHKKARAFVPINDGLLAVLKEWRKNCDTDYVVEFRGRAVGDIKKGFNKAVKRSGLKNVYPHALRHTAAVHMVASGCSMERVSQYMGHSSIAVTEKTYARFAPKHLRKEAEAIDFIKK